MDGQRAGRGAGAATDRFDLDRPVPAEADAVVIGGGVAGCSAAYQLAKRGKRVVLVEMRGICSGASGRNGGLTGGGTLVPTATGRAVHALSSENLRLLQDELPGEVGDDFALRIEGSLDIATTDEQWDHLVASHAAAATAGGDVELLDRQSLAELVPVVGDTVRGAKLSRRGGHLWPFALVHALANGARGRDALVFPWTPAEKVLTSNGSVTAVRTTAGTIATDTVVVATNAWTPMVLPDLPAGAVVPARGQILVTEPVGPVLSMPFGTNFDKEYGRQTVTGQLLCGGYRRLDIDEGLGHYEERVTAPVVSGIAACLGGIFPAVRRVGVVRAWAGIMGFTADGLPLIGRYGAARGMYVSAGYNGGGFSFAVAAGKAVGQLASGEDADLDLAPFDPDRFARGEVSWDNPFTAGEKSNPKRYAESGAIRASAPADC